MSKKIEVVDLQDEKQETLKDAIDYIRTVRTESWKYMLDTARSDNFAEVGCVACLVLQRKDGKRALVHEVCEYGDCDGADQIEDLFDELEAHVQPGEKLYVELVEFVAPEESE